ncbi:uncharacterized protein NFIA_066300 [Aspergillus fischeri NRRL 181]|uniref:Uncharacterized protein n=1 Tax=Neosartorya fischeri (strain ATCC 1020 / DSM 3700 / CBS 544.65 / FGSC A1164 / JCM 1740 / NRRL 181 / WB 181) TaxID=331117 RepID=A1D6X2_NEOFI|nr:conserved hypothetical protein [Aspergillus fischeri NRRL 181]EAW21466.1 conserved hypothetical protein [Aspergillus fischeri NRRL 181]KAG2017021.1 hypothetical protein GB937_005925 [Aspergillus fischeri]
MFAAIPPAQSYAFQASCSHYTPMHPSPLSPRSSTLVSARPMNGGPSASTAYTECPATSNTDRANSESTQAHNFSFCTENTNSTTTATTKSSPFSPRSRSSPTYAQRYAALSNPLNNASRTYATSISPSARNARRTVFLNRIKADRDAERFENRGEQLMMMEHVAEQKQWGELMRRRADGLMEAYQLNEDVGEEMDGIDDADVRALDEYVSEEQAMETALLETAHVPFGNTGRTHEANSFSDEEYDDIFMGLADQVPQSQDMDMSSG